jgi:hypothetical protein
MDSAVAPFLQRGQRLVHDNDNLAVTSPPLLRLRDGRMPGGQTLQGAIALTDAGRAVLSGTKDKIATCGSIAGSAACTCNRMQTSGAGTTGNNRIVARVA